MPQGRIADLKERGFANAGLYDPPGVGGTHVMYVLHHNDKPELYAGLAEQAEDRATRSRCGRACSSRCHWAASRSPRCSASSTTSRTGPNEVTDEDEENAKRLAEGS